MIWIKKETSKLGGSHDQVKPLWDFLLAGGLPLSGAKGVSVVGMIFPGCFQGLDNAKSPPRCPPLQKSCIFTPYRSNIGYGAVIPSF